MKESLFFLVVLMGGCAGERRLVTNWDEARDALGEEVSFVGTAVNCKLSAALMTDDFLVYCMEIAGWEETVEGKTVEATGKLEYTEQWVATVDADGAISQGTQSGVFVLRDARVRVMDDDNSSH